MSAKTEYQTKLRYPTSKPVSLDKYIPSTMMNSLMSEKFKRLCHMTGKRHDLTHSQFSSRISLNGDETTSTAGNTPSAAQTSGLSGTNPPTLTLSPLKKMIELESDASKNAADKLYLSESKPANQSSKNGGGGLELSGRKEKNLNLPPYQPYQLKPESSYSPSMLSKKRGVNRMNPMIKARYMAYQANEKIIQTINETHQRAALWMMEVRQAVKEREREALSRRNILRGIPDSVLAITVPEESEYLKITRRQVREAREAELAFLLEGQKSSIDAIHLQEVLQPVLEKRKHPKPVSREYTYWEKQRLSELLKD